MHRAKGDRFVRANELPVRQWFFSAYKPFLQENKKNPPRENRTYIIPIICYRSYNLTATLQRTISTNATHIEHSILDNLISSYSRRKLAKTTDNRSEIKLAYATPFELQGQKNTTIAVCFGSTLFASILNSPVMLGNYL